MKLVAIIKSVRENKIDKLFLDNSINIEYDLVDIYSVGSLELEADYRLFNGEEVPGTRIFVNEGVTYENLCPLSMLDDLVNDFVNQNSAISNSDLALRILEYIENDA